MMSGRSIAWALCLLLASACRPTPPEAPAEVEAAERTAGEATEEEPSLLDEVPMLPAQRRYAQSLQRNLNRDFAPYDVCRDRLIEEIAAEVRVGTTDRTKLEPLIAECTRIYEELVPVFMRFFDDVHAMLSKAQRKRLVALAYGEDDEEHDQLSEHEQIQKEQEGFLAKLDLSAGQKARMFPSLLGVYFRYMGPIGELRRSMREAKEAFLGSEFSSAELRFFRIDWIPLSRAILEAGEILLRVLEPAQRQVLADLILERW